MNQQEFQNQMNRLAETFGKAAYGTERAKLIWREVKDLGAHWLERVVDEFIGGRSAPLLNEFRDAIAKERERSRPNVQEEAWDGRPKSGCTYCFGNGVYICQLRTAGGFWAFRCHCDAGERDPRKGIPQFKEAHVKDFVWMDARALLHGSVA